MIIDIKEDEKKAKEWELSQSKETLTIREIAEIATTGITCCGDFCASREYTGEHRCFCIRSRFPTPEHYELYLIARQKFLQLLSAKLLAEAVGETEEKTQ